MHQAAASSEGLSWRDTGFRVYSQNEEDGLLLYVFSLIGTTSRFLIDIGCSTPEGSNSANLLLNHGWTGVLMDADPNAILGLRSFYGRHPDTWMLPPLALERRVTAENVNDLLDSTPLPDEVDLLSLDIDGIDYWVWRALELVRPRVVVVEVQVIWDADHSVTVPNDPDFRAIYRDGFAIYSGASMTAFAGMAAEKGYELVGSNRLGYNAFFVRSDLLPAEMELVNPAEITSLPFPRSVRARYFGEIENLPWVSRVTHASPLRVLVVYQGTVAEDHGGKRILEQMAWLVAEGCDVSLAPVWRRGDPRAGDIMCGSRRGDPRARSRRTPTGLGACTSSPQLRRALSGISRIWSDSDMPRTGSSSVTVQSQARMRSCGFSEQVAPFMSWDGDSLSRWYSTYARWLLHYDPARALHRASARSQQLDSSAG